MDAVYQGLRLFDQVPQGKANIVAGLLSKKTASISFLVAEGGWNDVFRDLEVEFRPLSDRVILATMSTWELDLLGKVKDSQGDNLELVE